MIPSFETLLTKNPASSGGDLGVRNFNEILAPLANRIAVDTGAEDPFVAQANQETSETLSFVDALQSQPQKQPQQEEVQPMIPQPLMPVDALGEGADDTPLGAVSGKFNDQAASKLSKLTAADKERMIRMTYAEAGSMGQNAMVGVAETMRNRLLAEGHPNTVREVTKWTDEGRGYYQSDAGNKRRFASIKPGSKGWKAAEAAVNASLSGSNLTEGALHNWGPKDGTAGGALAEMKKYGIKAAKGRIVGGEYYYRKPGENINPFK